MPKLLFIGLGQGDTKRYIVDSLLGHGYQPVVLASTVPPWLRQSTVDVEATDLDAGDATVRHAVALGRRYAVEGVFTCDEAYVELAAAVARKLGLPGLSASTALLCRDKHAMRRRLADAGVPSARSLVAYTPEEARRAATAIGYPVVLKPRNLGGSIGVVRADGPADVDRWFETAVGATMSRIRSLRGMLVEQYLDGPEYSVESVTVNGVTTVCGITEKLLGFPPFFEEIGHIARPVRPTDPLDALLVATTRQVHQALGVTVGLTHCELRATPDGPRVIEIAGRVGGDRIPVITKLATGVDLLAAGAAAATGRPTDTAPNLDRVAGIRMIYPSHDGTITRLAVSGSTAGILADLGWYATAGQQVALPPRGFLSRLGYLVAVADTRDEVLRRLDEGTALLDIGIDERDPVAAGQGGYPR